MQNTKQTKMKISTKLLSLLLVFTPIVTNAQKMLEAGTWYAFDIKNNNREMTITIVAGQDTERTSFEVVKKLEKVTKSGKKKKKGGFGKFIKELNSSNSKSSKKPAITNVIDGKYSYKYVTDNLDDEQYTSTYKFDRKLYTVDTEKIYGENSDIQGVYGFTYPIDGGFYKEVVFLKKGQYKNEKPNYVESVFIIGKDRDATKTKAESLSYDEEIKKYYTPDYSTGRTKNPAVVFGDYATELELDIENGELTLPYGTVVYYMPNKTIEGRNINYNWNALQITLSKDGQVIKTKAATRGHRNGKWLEKVRNQFDLSYRSFGKLKPGKYQLSYHIYDNAPFFTSNFEVYTMDNPDMNAEASTLYLLKGDYDNFVVIDTDIKEEKEYRKAIKFGIKPTRLVPMIGTRNRVDEFQVKLFKNNKLYALMSDYTGFSGGAKYLDHALKVFRVPLDVKGRGKHQDDVNVDFLIINKSVTHDKWKALDANNIQDGQYRIEYYTDGKLFADANFEVKNKAIVPQGRQVKASTNPKNLLFSDPVKPLLFIPLNYK